MRGMGTRSSWQPSREVGDPGHGFRECPEPSGFFQVSGFLVDPCLARFAADLEKASRPVILAAADVGRTGGVNNGARCALCRGNEFLHVLTDPLSDREIGRASCRERLWRE